jgi:hypothetical protein
MGARPRKFGILAEPSLFFLRNYRPKRTYSKLVRKEEYNWIKH